MRPNGLVKGGKQTLLLSAMGLVCALAMAPAPSEARGGGGHGGGGGHHHGGGGHHGGWHGSRVVVGVGLPGYWYGGWPYYSSYYYPSYYAAPYPYYAPAAFESAPVYAEPAPQQVSAPSYYYCAAAKGYYPYVRQCPEGWQRVPIAPPG